VLQFFGSIDVQLGVILFATSGADDSAKLPFRQAKRTYERPLAAISERTQNA
jgi:hypothetical protein